nr:DUF5714 domain-containing protein [Desulfotruncus arcticus]
MDYLKMGQEFICMYCGQKETGYVYCSNNHYICDNCHGKSSYEIILRLTLSVKCSNPIDIAEAMIKLAHLPMLGCEHALVAAGSFLAAVKNHGTIKITDNQIIETFNRTQKQAVGAYCGLTGICGVAVAIGASFSVILGAACPKDKETAITMHVVSRIISALANQTGPCCCKNFIRTALILSCQLTKEYFDMQLPCTKEIKCQDAHRHPHGCRKEKCIYYLNM